MKVAIVNFSGNVGKSTLAKHLFTPRLGLTTEDIVSVETINADEGGTQVGADKFRFIQEHLLFNDDAVIDVGSSNIEDFVAAMTRYRASHEDIDFFVVPVVPAVKQQKDTIATIEALHAIGVPAKKIRVVFNQVGSTQSPEEVFPAIFAYAEAEKKCVVRAGATVYENELFEDIKRLDRTVDDLVNDATDYRALLREAKDEDQKLAAKDVLLAKRLAPTVADNLSAVFKAVTK